MGKSWEELFWCQADIRIWLTEVEMFGNGQFNPIKGRATCHSVYASV